MMFTQHAVFAEPLGDDDTEEGEDQDTESEPETLDADTHQHDTATDNTQETDDKASDEPVPDWTVPPASTVLRFYSDAPGYLNTTTEGNVNTSHSITRDEGRSSVSANEPENPTPQWGQYRQELPLLPLWDASTNQYTFPT
jgi:hypothetical protein